MDLFSQNDAEQAIFWNILGTKNGNNIPDPSEIGIEKLKGDGDFRSKECIELLKQSDIVVTNPPFSLFREYVSQLIEHDKKFVIIGHQNAISYKEIFKLIKENKIWLGFGFKSGAAHFINKHYEDYAVAGDHKEGMIRVSGVVWFTNLDISKRHDDLILYKQYNDEEYPTYDNYDAINVNTTKAIPIDFKGVMGVPITFLDKYNPEQFEILGLSASAGYNKEIVGIPFLGDKDARPLINGKNTYARIFIRNKKSFEKSLLFKLMPKSRNVLSQQILTVEETYTILV